MFILSLNQIKISGIKLPPTYPLTLLQKINGYEKKHL